MSCGFIDQLPEFLVGALDDPAQREVEDHIAGCDVCSEELAALAELEFGLQALGAAGEPAPPMAPITPLRRWTPLAAAALLLVAGALALFAFRPTTATAPRLLSGRLAGISGGALPLGEELSVSAGDALLALPGGSLVEANQGARLVIDDERAIQLKSGTASFRISKGERPFRVHTPRGTVRVTGTSFRIDVLEDAVDAARSSVLVAVVTGTVLFEGKGGLLPVLAGQEAVADAQGAPRVRKKRPAPREPLANRAPLVSPDRLSALRSENLKLRAEKAALERERIRLAEELAAAKERLKTLARAPREERPQRKPEAAPVVTPQAPATLQRVLAYSRAGDRIRLRLRTGRHWQRYRLRVVGAKELRVSPRLPGTEDRYKGLIAIRYAVIAELENLTRNAPAALNPGDDAFARAKVAVGDIVGIGFDTGQVVHLGARTYTVRPWIRGAWAAQPAPRPRKAVRKVFHVRLTRRRSLPLSGGGLEVVSRRSRRAGRGLRFEVELEHDAQGSLVRGIELRFELSRSVCMEPGTPPAAVEVKRILLPLVSGQRQVIRHRVAERAYLDGRVVARLLPGSVAELRSPGARKHLLLALRATPLERSVLQAAARTGGRELALALIERAIAATGKVRTEVENTLAGGTFRALVPQLLLETLTPDQRQPPERSRRLIALLARLPRGLAARHEGQTLFDLYVTRRDLSHAIERAYAASPAQALAHALPVAAARKSSPRAERAVALLVALEAQVAPQLRELLELDRPVGVIEALEVARAREHAIARSKLAGLVERARSLQEAGQARRALALIRRVLASGDHPAAQSLLPHLLLDVAARETKTRRGDAARRYEEALELLPRDERTLAAKPLAAFFLAAAREELDGITVRRRAHAAAHGVRLVRQGDELPGVARKRWVRVELPKRGRGYLPRALLAPVDAQRTRWRVALAHTPFAMIKELLERAQELDPSCGDRAAQLLGTLAAREGKVRFEAGDYKGALRFFDAAAGSVPEDPRLALRRRCWALANIAPLGTGLLALLLLLGLGLLQLLTRRRHPRVIPLVTTG